MKKRVISLLLVAVFVISFLPSNGFAVDTLSSAPYARVNYSYSSGVSAGTIRYMSQKESSGYFYSAYWGDWISKRIPNVYSGPGSECGTCSMSMALSYIGVNKTPEDILDSGNGVTYWDWSGTTRSQPSVSSGMSNYISGGGKYSPVVICLIGAGAYNSYTGKYNDHYIVLVGRISGETYHYLDPASDSLGTTTISGSSATYKSSSYTIRETHQWYNPNGSVAPHTSHDKGTYMYYEAAHPHHNCYRCSVCGTIWVDTSSSNTVDSCDQCAKPGKPELSGLKEYYTREENVVYSWNPTTNTTHYNVWVYKRNDRGTWDEYDHKTEVKSGMVEPSEPGIYRVQLQAYNSNAWESDHSDWKHTVSDDYIYIYDHAKGKCGDNAYWRVDYGVLTIWGSGSTYDYNDKTTIPWYPVKDTIEKVVISEGITALGVQTCYSLTNVKEIQLPSTLTKLGTWAFDYCKSLEQITLPDSINELSYSVLFNCKALRDVNIPKSLSYIGEHMFNNCISLQSIVIPANIKTIKDNAFLNCTALTDVFYEGTAAQWSKISIGENNECLKNATIHYGSMSGKCGDNATWHFDGRTLFIEGSGETYDYPGSEDAPWRSVHDYIHNVVVAEGITGLGIGTIYWCDYLTSVQLPSTMTKLGTWCFDHCTRLKQIRLPDSINELGYSVFLNCYGLENVNIPESLSYVGEHMFNHCTALKSIVIPSGIKEIKDNAFLECTALQDVYYEGTADDWKAITIGQNNDCLKNATIHYGAMSGKCGDNATWSFDGTVLTISGYGDTYDYPGQEDAPWWKIRENVRAVVVEDGITGLGSGTFYRCSNLTSVQLPDSLTKLGTWCFDQCSSLESIVLPDSINELGFSVFLLCKSLKTVNIPRSLTYIGEHMFNTCTSLTSITIPSNIIEIKDNAFLKCRSLVDVYYEGSYVQSAKVSVGSNNDFLEDANWYFNGARATDENAIIFDTQGGIYSTDLDKSLSSKTITIMSQYGNLPVPTKDGYVFIGWEDLDGNIVGYDDYYSSIQLRAVWATPDSITPDERCTYADNGHIYERYDCHMTWEEAKLFCEQKGGHLVTITDANEQAIVSSLIVGADNYLYFIGCSDAKKEGTWEWVTGEEFEYTNWDPQYPEPDNASGYNYGGIVNKEIKPNKQFAEWLSNVNRPDSVNGKYWVGNYGFICEYDAEVHSHELVAVAKVSATCTKDGTEAYWKCDGCGKLFSDAQGRNEISTPVAIRATGHKTELQNDNAATCTEDGYTGDEVCTNCGETIKKGSIIKASGHNWSDWKVTKAATETAEGVEVRGCDTCGEIETRSIPKLAHTHKLTAVAKVAATCTKDGTEAYWKCDDCGKMFSDAQGKNEISAPVVIKATGHEWDSGKVTKEPTETAEGVKTFTCTVCGETRTENIPKLTHTHKLTAVAKVAATCTKDGAEAYWKCSSCGKMFSDAQGKNEISAPVVIKATGHSWDSGAVTKAATCTEAGVRTFTCKHNSSHTRTEAIPALGHDYKAVVTAPTCTEKGNTTHTCSRCGDSYVDSYVNALGHKTELRNAKAATCTADGYTGDEICSTCGEIIRKGTVIKATGHKWDSGKVTKEPTEAAEGVKTFTCTVCGETRTEAIPKLTPITPPAPTNPFVDVKQGEYYYDPVLWAVNHQPQITNGTSTTTFSPDATCTRGQVVTFLWRANGCPDPKSTSNPFQDVASGAYYYKAVLWAVENEITNGTSATTFSPEDPCTRAHVVTFLWRSANKPAAGSTNPFHDVAAGQYYTDAVLWAVSKNITNGTSATTFSPDNPCTRGQIVTFLYRYMK